MSSETTSIWIDGLTPTGQLADAVACLMKVGGVNTEERATTLLDGGKRFIADGLPAERAQVIVAALGKHGVNAGAELREPPRKKGKKTRVEPAKETAEETTGETANETTDVIADQPDAAPDTDDSDMEENAGQLLSVAVPSRLRSSDMREKAQANDGLIARFERLAVFVAARYIAIFVMFLVLSSMALWGMLSMLPEPDYPVDGRDLAKAVLQNQPLPEGELKSSASMGLVTAVIGGEPAVDKTRRPTFMPPSLRVLLDEYGIPHSVATTEPFGPENWEQIESFINGFSSLTLVQGKAILLKPRTQNMPAERREKYLSEAEDFLPRFLGNLASGDHSMLMGLEDNELPALAVLAREITRQNQQAELNRQNQKVVRAAMLRYTLIAILLIALCSLILVMLSIQKTFARTNELLEQRSERR